MDIAEAPMHPPGVLEALRDHGSHSLAYSILQPGMEYFGDRHRGLIGFRRRLGQAIVLGDPVAPAEGIPALLDAFLQAHPRACFMQVHRDTAEYLQRAGFLATPVGVENTIDPATFSLVGRRKADLRHYRNRAAAAGLVVAEEADTVPLRQELKAVSDDWLPSKSWFGHELEFLARPYLLEPEPDVRIFVARRDGAAIAFTVLDPMYRHGRPVGYTVTLLRHRFGAPEGAVDYVNLHVLAQFREERLECLSLGVSPFDQMREFARLDGLGAPLVYLLFRALNRWGSPIYHFAGLSFHKARYRAETAPVYTCTRAPLGLLPVFASARACKMM